MLKRTVKTAYDGAAAMSRMYVVTTESEEPPAPSLGGEQVRQREKKSKKYQIEPMMHIALRARG
jgi:hypothetical protein